jgi:hypothetical protein
MKARQQSLFSDAEFWQGSPTPYVVTAAFRQNVGGQPFYPVPDSHANCWIILHEVPEGIDGVPMIDLIGEFDSRDTAEWICGLIRQATHAQSH